MPTRHRPAERRTARGHSRRWVVAGIVSTGALALGWGGVELDRYSQTDAFCGSVCHRPMGPQHTTHGSGTHANVRCTECHVGTSGWAHVRAKVRGVEHLVSQLSGDYERPIRASVGELRLPANRCAPCHRATELPRAKQVQATRYGFDRRNSAHRVALTLKIGERDGSATLRGIAWHMATPGSVTLAVPTSNAATIPWVEVRRPDGTTTIYTSTDANTEHALLDGLVKRPMDCADCHNRTAHRFVLPDSALDQAMFNGSLSPTLPSIKRLLTDALGTPGLTAETVAQSVRTVVTRAYQKTDPDVLLQRSHQIEAAIAVASKLHAGAVFPHLAADWHAYPNHIGHRFSAGCFRCHDGRHVSAEGAVLPSSCETCHTPPRLTTSLPSGQFPTHSLPDWHPWKLPTITPAIRGHERLLCFDCHASGLVPKIACEDCHHAPGT